MHGMPSKHHLRSLIACVTAYLLAACSTTYHVAPQDLERLKAGYQVSDLKDERGQSVDVTHYTFDYKIPDHKAAQRLTGIEALNQSLEARKLYDITSMSAVPGHGDKWVQRVLLGGGVGAIAGFGIGYAVTNRVALERVAAQGASCSQCSFGVVMLGSAISAVLGMAVGGLTAYFAGSGIGESEVGSFTYLDDPVAEPASQEASSAPVMHQGQPQP